MRAEELPWRRPLADRVQRIVEGDTPVLHLEPEMPRGPWPVVVDGLVESRSALPVHQLRGFRGMVRYIDLHCVWGWSSPSGRWEGVTLDHLAHAAPQARFVRIEAVPCGEREPYASCFTIDEARAGLFAWALDGKDLPPERGGPLRFVPPSFKWGYKSVKWVARITFLDEFRPGFWEERVGDPVGTVPWSVLRRFQTQTERRTRRRA